MITAKEFLNTRKEIPEEDFSPLLTKLPEVEKYIIEQMEAYADYKINQVYGTELRFLRRLAKISPLVRLKENWKMSLHDFWKNLFWKKR